MNLTSNRTVEKSKMEKEQKSKEKSPELVAAEQENKVLQEQLKQLSSDRESSVLEKEAEELAKKTATLEEEADLRKVLGEEFSTVKSSLREGEEISPEQMVAIMADAVGASSDAQGKLILNKVNEMMGKSNVELQKTQKLLIELAAGVSMNQTRSNNPDFDDYRTEVAGIMSVTRGLSTDDALVLARAKRSKGQPDQRQTASERPSSPPMGASSRDDYVKEQKNDDVQLSPRAVFRAAAEAAIEKTLAAKQR